MPAPDKISFVQGKMYIDAGFRVELTGYEEPRLHRAIDRLIRRLTVQTGNPFSTGGGEENVEVSLVIQCSGPGEKIQSVGEDESYTLDINSARAELTAPTPLGILCGIETLLQLVEFDTVGRLYYNLSNLMQWDFLFPQFTSKMNRGFLGEGFSSMSVATGCP
jgi:hexosaminidase